MILNIYIYTCIYICVCVCVCVCVCLYIYIFFLTNIQENGQTVVNISFSILDLHVNGITSYLDDYHLHYSTK